MSEKWAVGAMGCRNNGPSEQWAVGIMTWPRTCNVCQYATCCLVFKGAPIRHQQNWRSQNTDLLLKVALKTSINKIIFIEISIWEVLMNVFLDIFGLMIIWIKYRYQLAVSCIFNAKTKKHKIFFENKYLFLCTVPCRVSRTMMQSQKNNGINHW